MLNITRVLATVAMFVIGGFAPAFAADQVAQFPAVVAPVPMSDDVSRFVGRWEMTMIVDSGSAGPAVNSAVDRIIMTIDRAPQPGYLQVRAVQQSTTYPDRQIPGPTLIFPVVNGSFTYYNPDSGAEYIGLRVEGNTMSGEFHNGKRSDRRPVQFKRG